MKAAATKALYDYNKVSGKYSCSICGTSHGSKSDLTKHLQSKSHADVLALADAS